MRRVRSLTLPGAGVPCCPAPVSLLSGTGIAGIRYVSLVSGTGTLVPAPVRGTGVRHRYAKRYRHSPVRHRYRHRYAGVRHRYAGTGIAGTGIPVSGTGTGTGTLVSGTGTRHRYGTYAAPVSRYPYPDQEN